MNDKTLDIILDVAVAGIQLAAKGAAYIANSMDFTGEQKAKAFERIAREMEAVNVKVQAFKVHPFQGSDVPKAS